MSRIIIAAVCVLFAGISHAQDDHPAFDDPGPNYIKEGDEINLSCTTQADVQFMASKQLAIVHMNRVTKVNTTISEQESILVDNLDNYVIKLEMIPIVRVTLKIKSASAANDGQYRCRTQKTGTSKAKEFVAKEVVFVAPVSEVKLTVNQELKADGDTIESKPGTMMVTCEAMGSNPAPLIHVMVGDQTMETGPVNTILDKDGNTVRQSFKASVTFELDFDHTMFDKTLTCHAKPDLPDGVPPPNPADMTVTVNLKGIVDKPVVTCTNNTASMKDRRVKLICYVSKVPRVKSVLFNVGNRHQLYPGNQTESLTEVIQKEVNDTHNEVILKFHEMKDWHFSANIFLDVKTYDDQVYQYPVYLLKADICVYRENRKHQYICINTISATNLSYPQLQIRFNACDTPSENDVSGATSLSGAMTLLTVCLLAGVLQKVL